MSEELSLSDLEKRMHDASKRLKGAERFLWDLKCAGTQSTYSVKVGVLDIPITFMDRSTGYEARQVPENTVLLELIKKHAEDHVFSCKSQLEGAQFMLVKRAKEIANKGGAT